MYSTCMQNAVFCILTHEDSPESKAEPEMLRLRSSFSLHSGTPVATSQEAPYSPLGILRQALASHEWENTGLPTFLRR
jgi:hypothetical protein